MSALLANERQTNGDGNRNLDALRALAVLMVLSDHIAHVFTSSQENFFIEGMVGRFGVLLFFLHTSLVLMMSIQRNSAEAIGVGAFYLRRAFRIYPLSILCVFIVILFRIPPSPPNVFANPSILKVAANFALMQNLFVPPSPGTNISLSSPLWSLPFEIQMYVFLPGIFWFIKKHGRKSVWLLIEASVVLAIADILLFPNHVWVAEFFPCFMGGILAYTLMHREPRMPHWLWIPTLCVIAVAGVALHLHAPVEWVLCLAIGALIPLFRESPKGILSRVSFTIAKYSYGIYLSHVPLLWFCFTYLHTSLKVSSLLFCPLAIVVPFALYHLVEAPAIAFGRRLASLSVAATVSQGT